MLFRSRRGCIPKRHVFEHVGGTESVDLRFDDQQVKSLSPRVSHSPSPSSSPGRIYTPLSLFPVFIFLHAFLSRHPARQHWFLQRPPLHRAEHRYLTPYEYHEVCTVSLSRKRHDHLWVLTAEPKIPGRNTSAQPSFFPQRVVVNIWTVALLDA